MTGSLRLGVLALLLGLVPAGTVSSSAATMRPAAECCTVTYNKTHTAVQVTGYVHFKGRAVLFSFYAPCASRAGEGRAYIKSKWIPLEDITKGYHRIQIVQDVNGKIVISYSPRFFVDGTEQNKKPAATIRSGPSGDVGTSVTFDVLVANTPRPVYRLDSDKWTLVTSRYISFKGLAPGEHVFQLRAYAFSGNSYAEVDRRFNVVG